MLPTVAMYGAEAKKGITMVSEHISPNTGSRAFALKTSVDQGDDFARLKTVPPGLNSDDDQFKYGCR